MMNMKPFSKKKRNEKKLTPACPVSRRESRARGFTLVEVLVAMSVFIIIVTVAVAVFVNALRNQRLLTERMSVNNNMSTVLEQMAREIRTGYSFPSASDTCLSSLTFFNSQHSDPTGADAQTTYALSGGSITRSEGGNTETLTASNVEVKNLCFKVLQYEGEGSQQKCNPPRIAIAIAVGVKGAGPDVPATYLGTTVSSRILPAEIKNDPYSCRTQ